MPMSRYLWHCLCPWHRFPAYIRLCQLVRQFGVHEEAPIRNGASGTGWTQCSRYPKRFHAIASGTANKDENLAAIAKDDGAGDLPHGSRFDSDEHRNKISSGPR